MTITDPPLPFFSLSLSLFLSFPFPFFFSLFFLLPLLLLLLLLSQFHKTSKNFITPFIFWAEKHDECAHTRPVKKRC